MKFDFQNSKYVKMFEDSLEGRQIISYILNDPEMIRSNFDAWRKWFSVDPNVTPTASDGTASFTVSAKLPERSDMMDWRAPLGDSRLAEQMGGARYSGSIVDFIAKGFKEQAMEREYKERIFSEFGSDAPLLLSYATDVLQPRIDSANQTLTHLSAQAMSQGNIVYKGGQGIAGAVYKAPIPEANFAKAGKKVWNAADCELLNQMAEIEREYREEKWGLENISLVWEIPYDMWKNVFLKNKQVIDWTKQLMYQNGRPIYDNMIVQESDVATFIRQFEGLSPIRVVSEKQRNDDAIVSGWKENIAVLHPAGYSGIVMHTEILDEKMYTKYGNNVISRAFGRTLDGLVTVMNSTVPNGNMKEWHTDVMMSAVPVLTDFPYHVIVDTQNAGE